MFPCIEGTSSLCRSFSIHKEVLLRSATNNISHHKNASQFDEFNRTTKSTHQQINTETSISVRTNNITMFRRLNESVKIRIHLELLLLNTASKIHSRRFFVDISKIKGRAYLPGGPPMVQALWMTGIAKTS